MYSLGLNLWVKAHDRGGTLAWCVVGRFLGSLLAKALWKFPTADSHPWNLKLGFPLILISIHLSRGPRIWSLIGLFRLVYIVVNQDLIYVWQWLVLLILLVLLELDSARHSNSLPGLVRVAWGTLEVRMAIVFIVLIIDFLRSVYILDFNTTIAKSRLWYHLRNIILGEIGHDRRPSWWYEI